MNATAQPAPPTSAEISGFSDRLSPILVKELRQGLRTRVFVSLFIALQVLMTLLVVTSLLAASQDVDASASGPLFWAMISLPVLFILPLRGLGSVSNEIKANTLELILLTRLSARRIIVGKWLAIVAQTTLFVCAVLPYVVLRYFMGGVNLLDELFGLGSMLLTSAILTGVAVGISPYQNRLTRILLWIGIIFFAQAVLPLLFFGVSFGNQVLRGSPGFDWTFWVAIPSYGLLILLLMLEIGAGKIAPEADKHALGRRLIGVLLVALAAGFTILQSPAAIAVTVTSLILCVPLLIGAVGESIRWNAGIFRSLARRGPLGRIAGRFLYTGWPAGTLYALAIFAALGTILYFAGGFNDIIFPVLYLALIGAILAPMALIRALVPRHPRPMLIFTAIQTLCILAAVFSMILDNIFDSSSHDVLAYVPTSTLVIALFQQLDDVNLTALLTFLTVVVTLSAVTLLARSIPEWRRIAQLESPAPPPADAPVA